MALPSWLNYTSAVSSIIGLAVSVFVLYEAKQIRQSFMRRARLPEIAADVGKVSSNLLKSLKDWPKEQRLGIAQIHIAVGLLRNAANKVPDSDQKRINQAIAKLCKRKFFRMEPVNDATVEEAWAFYYELSSINTLLEQLVKDTKWD